jgi:hypothetical protein
MMESEFPESGDQVEFIPDDFGEHDTEGRGLCVKADANGGAYIFEVMTDETLDELRVYRFQATNRKLLFTGLVIGISDIEGTNLVKLRLTSF